MVAQFDRRKSHVVVMIALHVYLFVSGEGVLFIAQCLVIEGRGDELYVDNSVLMKLLCTVSLLANITTKKPVAREGNRRGATDFNAIRFRIWRVCHRCGTRIHGKGLRGPGRGAACVSVARSRAASILVWVTPAAFT